MRAALALPLLLSVAACTPAWRQAMDRAEAARTAGDDVTAARELADACATAPADSGACEAAAASATRAATAAMARGEEACRAGELAACLDAVGAARSVQAANGPDRAAIEQLIDAAGAAHVERCRGRPLESIDDAIARSRCVAARQADVQLRSHDLRVRDARTETAAFLLREARSFDKSSAEGAAAAFASLAACVGGPDGGVSTFAEDARARFLADNTVSVQVSVSGLGADSVTRLCDRLASQTALRCAARGEKAALTVSGFFVAGDVEHTFVQVDRAVEYVAGIDRYRNAEHDRLAAEVESQRRELRVLETDARVANADCETARGALRRAGSCYDCWARTQAEERCNRADAFTSVHRGAVNDLNAQISLLASTPAIVEQERRATHGYTETAHRWQLPYELRMGDAPTLNDAVIVDDSEHPGFAPASLAKKTARAPNARDMLATAESRAVERLFDDLRQRLKRRGVTLADTCSDVRDGGERVECGLRAIWWIGREPVSTWLAAVSDRVATPWPKAPCAR